MGGLSEYLSKVRTAVTRRNGTQVAALLDVTELAQGNVAAKQGAGKKKKGNLVLKDLNELKSLSEAQVEAKCGGALGSLDSSFGDVILACALCAKFLKSGDPIEAYDRLVMGVQPFIDLFRAEEETWVVNPLHGMVANIRIVAEVADEALKLKGERPEKLENAGNHLMSCFAAANRPQGNPDKRLATLRIVNSLFRIYFKLNTLRNCKYLVRVVDTKKFVAFSNFVAGDRVTYKYFVGRLAVFDENFEDAERHLTYAFGHCHPTHVKNRRLILKYLVPVKILVTQSLPSDLLLTRYDLQSWYAGIKRAIKTGSVREFEKALNERMEDYVEAGIFLLIEKLRVRVYRRLLKRTQIIHGLFKPDKAVQVPLKYFVRALQWEGYACDLDEVECIVANQIYNGYVKGYISHKSGVVVLSKKDPFPPIAI